MGTSTHHVPEHGARHGGVVFRAGGALLFVPATVALRVAPRPEVARIPGAPAELCGVALVDGDMIPVVEVNAVGAREGGRGGAMLVCAVLGERVGLVGIEVVATGHFEAGEWPGDVRLGAETAEGFDVAALIARVREGRWAV